MNSSSKRLGVYLAKLALTLAEPTYPNKVFYLNRRNLDAN